MRYRQGRTTSEPTKRARSIKRSSGVIVFVRVLRIPGVKAAIRLRKRGQDDAFRHLSIFLGSLVCCRFYFLPARSGTDVLSGDGHGNYRESCSRSGVWSVRLAWDERWPTPANDRVSTFCRLGT